MAASRSRRPQQYVWYAPADPLSTRELLHADHHDDIWNVVDSIPSADSVLERASDIVSAIEEQMKPMLPFSTNLRRELLAEEFQKCVLSSKRKTRRLRLTLTSHSLRKQACLPETVIGFYGGLYQYSWL